MSPWSYFVVVYVKQIQVDLFPAIHFALQLREVWMLDATQRKLSKQLAVRNIGWHPVLDRMFRSMPYDAANMPSWGRNVPRSYGIPKTRQM